MRLLEKLFTPEHAELAAELRLTPEPPDEIAARLGKDARSVRTLLKEMTRRGLITAERSERGFAYGLMPFAVGIYEMQASTIDEELARLFEAYYQEAFGKVLTQAPQVHRVVPVQESVRADMEIAPYESAAGIVAQAKSWGVMDCICRKQQALIGQACGHPLDVCMVLADSPGVYDGHPVIRALTQEEALATLKRAADAGLVHSVSNTQRGHWYICNCCTCGCGILRGVVELGMANVVARSAFVNQVDADLCIGCGICVERCPFGALSLEGVAQLDPVRCVGCGVCIGTCPVTALSMVRRPADEVLPPPETSDEWRVVRAEARGLDLEQVL